MRRWTKLDRLNRTIVRATFEERFTADRMAQDYLDIYRGLPGVDDTAIPLPHVLGGRGSKTVHVAE